MWVTPAIAIEAPMDEAQPPCIVQPAPETPPAKLPPATAEAPVQVTPPPATRPTAPDAVKPAPKAQPAFLGVISMPVPDILVDHLGLKKDGGIVVQALCPLDGPAAKAGVAVNDVITRIGDQPVTSPSDLTKSVSSHKPGDKVHLDLIHLGKAAGIDVTLGTRPDDLATINRNPPDHNQLDRLLEGMPKELADRVRRGIAGNLGDADMDVQEGVLEMAPQMQELKKRMEKAMQGMNGQALVPGIVPKIDIQQGATFRMMDNEGSIELKSNDGGKEVTVRDKDNKISWSGPWDTDQDKAAAPAEVRKRMERLHLDTQFQGNGLRLHLAAPPADDQP